MPLVPKREDVLLEHQAVLCCAGDGELARVVQRGSRASSLEILRSCLERGLSNLLWMSLTEQGLEQMDLEVLPHLNQSLHPWTSCLCWNQILAFLLINLSSLSFLGVWSLVSDCNTTLIFHEELNSLWWMALDEKKPLRIYRMSDLHCLSFYSSRYHNVYINSVSVWACIFKMKMNISISCKISLELVHLTKTNCRIQN